MMKNLYLLLIAATISPLALPATVDLHAHWDQRCQSCHGHAGAFARRFLRIENDQLVGAHHNSNLDAFLRNHYLNDELVAPVTAMLKAQVASRPLFNQKCAGCHGTAAEFARLSLLIKDGVLIRKSNGRKVVDDLASHGRLKPDEVQIVIDSLTRVRLEVSGAAK